MLGPVRGVTLSTPETPPFVAEVHEWRLTTFGTKNMVIPSAAEAMDPMRAMLVAIRTTLNLVIREQSWTVCAFW
jgi:hypothetical protein